MENCIRTYKELSQIEHAKSVLSESELAFERYSELLSLSGNVTRLKILVLISQDDELCVCDLSDVLEMSMPAVSQHLKKLREGRMIKNRRHAQTIFYSLTQIGQEFITISIKQMELKELSNAV